VLLDKLDKQPFIADETGIGGRVLGGSGGEGPLLFPC
jgi:hypothetical protein